MTGLLNNTISWSTGAVSGFANLALYDGWHEFFRNKQPKMLIVWGKNDPFFTVEGAQAYLRDIPKAELHLLDTGHFALEDSCEFIAQQIVKFFA